MECEADAKPILLLKNRLPGGGEGACEVVQINSDDEAPVDGFGTNGESIRESVEDVSASDGTLGQTDRRERVAAKIRPFDRLVAWLDENERKPIRHKKDKAENYLAQIWLEYVKEYALFLAW